MKEEATGRRKAILSAFTEFHQYVKAGMAEDKSAPVKCSRCGKEFSTENKIREINKKFIENCSYDSNHSHQVLNYFQLCSNCRQSKMLSGLP